MFNTDRLSLALNPEAKLGGWFIGLDLKHKEMNKTTLVTYNVTTFSKYAGSLKLITLLDFCLR